ncbi:MAG TPA: DUF748 domain-containing protein [Woeseiaceae bacterium]|nr:DUF748 domain-containing protein [Woeseiaceae bacterium]
MFNSVIYKLRHYLAVLCAVLLSYAIFGFLVLPWLVNRYAVEMVRNDYGAELRLAGVACNPFVLSVTVDGFELHNPAGDLVAQADTIFVNFQASSLFRWAFTFAEIRLDAPELFVARDQRGALNIAYLMQGSDAAADADLASPGLPRVLVLDFAINDLAIKWNDQLPAEPVASHLGPVNVRIAELNTLPQRSGDQAVVITTEGGGTLAWTGKLQLNPLQSSGHATLGGALFALPAAYIKQQSGFDIVRGQADVSLDYNIEVDATGELRARIDNADVKFNDMQVNKAARVFTGQPSPDRELLILPAFHLAGGTILWPQRSAAFKSLAIDDASLNIYRDGDGRINLLPDTASLPDSDAAALVDNEAATTATDDAWDLSLERLELNRMILGLDDHSVEPPADIGLKTLDLVISNISNRPGASFPSRAVMETRSGGTVTIEGPAVVLPEPNVSMHIVAKDLSLALLHPYLQPLANVSLDTGTLSFDAGFRTDADEEFSFAGDAAIDNFLITETAEGSRLGSWDRVEIRKLDFSLAKRMLNISEIELHNAYADIFVAADGSVNLGRVEKGAAAGDGDKGTAASVTEGPERRNDAEMQVLIGRVIFADAGADYADESLPLPFAARVAELKGEISTIATASNEPSKVALEGKVDEHGFVQVSGTVTPLDPAWNTDMKVAFRNVEIPKFSAYTIEFAGRKLASGKLDLDLGYQVKKQKLVGENKIVLRDFELGDKVDHPGAMSLPLGLAVALLKDSSGKIDIDLPVRGDLNDPEFRYGGIIWKALSSLIIKIVASPFALLGNLIGVSPDELAHINFLDGRADLTPPELERAGNLVEALSLRPQLVLEIPGVVDSAVDGHALKVARVAELVEQRIGAAATSNENSTYAEQQQEALEALYQESSAGVDAGATLEAMRQSFTTAPLDDKGKPGKEQFDAPAYAAELERVLVERQTVSEQDLRELANQRATNLRDAITLLNPGLANRLVIAQPKEISKGNDDAIEMKVTLSADRAVLGTDAVPGAGADAKQQVQFVNE